MNKDTLVRDLAKKFDLPINKTNEIIVALLESISKSLAKGESVTFIGFGSFVVKKRLARQGRNPQTGETIKIPARKVVKFSVGKALKDSTNKK